MFASFHFNTVFHGTNLFSAKLIKHYGVLLHAQRELTDFGRGFYVTTNLHQAKEWAKVKAQNPQINERVLQRYNIKKEAYLHHPDTKIPAYIRFHIYLDSLFQLKGAVFPLPYEPQWNQYKIAWKSFVQNCRIGIKHKYDFVYGPVGRSYNDSYVKVKPSKFKDQLSLNSIHAIQCLSSLQIIPLSLQNDTPEPLSIMTTHHSIQRRTLEKNRNKLYLEKIRDELVNISSYSYPYATRLINNSWLASQVDKQESIILHEPPLFWAFYILYGKKKLWYKDFETYIVQQNI